MMREIMSASAAAKIIGCSPQMVREQMRRGNWDLGDVITKKQTGLSNDRFIVFRWKLEKLLGKGGNFNAGETVGLCQRR